MGYDAIVVGGGPNGLAAAITLAEHGRSVLVVEARGKLGGAVATDELTLPGFSHDTFSSVYPAGVASPVWARMPLARYGLRWIHPQIPMAHPLPDGSAMALYRDVAATAATLDRQAAGDGERWRALVTPYLRHFGALRKTMLGGFPPIGGGLRLVAGLKLTGTLEFARLALMPASALAGELFHSTGSTAWLYGSALHGDVPPRGSGSAILAVYLNVLGHAVGWPSPAGGAGRLAEALAGYLRHLGGQTRVDTRIQRIVIEGGRVRGVALEGGEMLSAPVVIADLTPRGLLEVAGAALPAAYVARMARFRYGPETIKLDWALSAPIPWIAPEPRLAGTVHVGGDAAEIEAALLRQMMGELSERPFLLLGQQSLVDPSRAPAGQHTAWAYTHTPIGYHWTRDEVRRHSERIEAQVERFAPGFGARVLARHVITPASFEERNANLVGGDVGSGSYALDQLVFRPIPSLSPYRTPIAGLYLGSASTFPGGAVHGVSGHAAARLALLEGRLRRYWPARRTAARRASESLTQPAETAPLREGDGGERGDDARLEARVP